MRMFSLTLALLLLGPTAVPAYEDKDTIHEGFVDFFKDVEAIISPKPVEDRKTLKEVAEETVRYAVLDEPDR